MWFDGRLIAELTPKDIQQLVDDGAEEDEGIEFKVEPYGGSNLSEERKFELCCDVAAFANSQGGYIIIGIRDKNNRASGICPISNPDLFVERMYKTCLDGIYPRMESLDMKAVGVGKDKSVIVIRVPPSANQPYMVTIGNRTHFCRRYKDIKRELSYKEIEAAFKSDRVEHKLVQMNERLEELVHRAVSQPPVPVRAEDNLLLARTPKDIQQIMEARLMEVAAQ